MTMHQPDPRPFHQRMESSAVKHLVAVLKYLSGGSIGFDPYRDERTQTKEALVSYILSKHSPESIDEAHLAVIATYPKTGRGRRSRRSQSTVEPSAPVAAEPASPAAPAPTNTNDPSLVLSGLNALIASAVAQHVAGHMTGVNAQIEKIAGDVAASIAASSKASSGVTVVELKRPDLPDVSIGLQHKQFPALLKMCSARLRNDSGLNVWLYGPAGTGKTTAAEKVAEALELPFRYNGALDTRYELLGFIDANGKVVRTAFRDAWEHGGIYLFDEIDASNPNALLALNGALANGTCPFPDGMIKRHKDCVVIAGANTTGLGATVEYVGRMKQDASLLDRFVFLDWPIDEALEDALCADKDWVRYVQRVRRNIAERGVKGAMVTPRATFHGEALLAAGLSRDAVIASVLRKSMTDEAWSQVC